MRLINVLSFHIYVSLSLLMAFLQIHKWEFFNLALINFAIINYLQKVCYAQMVVNHQSPLISCNIVISYLQFSLLSKKVQFDKDFHLKGHFLNNYFNQNKNVKALAIQNNFFFSLLLIIRKKLIMRDTVDQMENACKPPVNQWNSFSSEKSLETA